MSDKRPPAEVGTTSASGGASNQESWKLSLPCTKAEAEAIAAAEVDGAVLVTTEEDEAAGRWRLDAYFEGEPDAATLAAVRSLVADNSEVQPEPLPPEDWVTLSQAGLEPIREGRFFVHTAAHAEDVPAGAVAFRIEAGQAFGTGHHHTTAGCLAMLDGLAGERFGRVIDLGTGTGLLAFAARRARDRDRHRPCRGRGVAGEHGGQRAKRDRVDRGGRRTRSGDRGGRAL
jgi:ribosomal protein L11 methyltransferase